jgi:Cell wall-active antibiotics response 4TMS YvqF
MTRRPVTRGSRLLRALLLVLIASAVGQLVAKRMTNGDENSDSFRLAVIGGGKDKELKSRATALRSASGPAVMGGVEIDLREATLDTRGATLDVTGIMGGVKVTLPSGWLVDLDTHGILGGVSNRLTESADHPEGAPTLHVTTNTWLGGVGISD